MHARRFGPIHTLPGLVVATVLVAAGLHILPAPADVAAAGAAAESVWGAGAEGGEPSHFQPVGPVRLADTREPSCGCAHIDPHTIRITIAGRPGIGADISAAALTITATGGSTAGFVTVFPSGQQRPATSTLNVAAGADASNSTIIPVGATGSVDVFASTDASLIVDITGSFVPSDTATSGRYLPTLGARLLDTRNSMVLGIAPGSSVTLPLPSAVDAGARGVVVNVTSVGAVRRGFLTGYAAGSAAPATSFMNPNGSGAAIAASVILPVSASGLTIASSAGGHVIVDLVGWFTGDSAPSSSNGLLVAVEPARLLDTRTDLPRLWPNGVREVPSPFGSAAALVTNVTSVEADGPGFVTAFPAGTTLPPTSSLNAAHRNATTPNLALTSVSGRGTAYYSNRGTDLIVDVTGYFTGAPLVATTPVPPNVAPVPRVLMIGDSTLGGLVDVQATQSGLRGFGVVLDAKSCRLLVHPSCTSRLTPVAPNTALDAINRANGTFDIVVIKTGYNDAARDFAGAVGVIVAAARAKGAQQVIWLTYSESTTAGSYNIRNGYLKGLVGSSEFPDLAVADWRSYAAASNGWYAADRVHLLTLGVWATADYVSRWVAHVSHLPCPVPWTVGAPLQNPCPNPDSYALASSTTPDLRGLYGL